MILFLLKGKVAEKFYFIFSTDSSIFICIIQYCCELNICFIDKYDNT